MKTKLINQYYTLPLDEKANVVTHGIACIFALFLTPVLLMSEPYSIKFWGLFAFSFGMIFMFFSSTMYHLANKDILKNRWRVVDHISIFILIGCTYTPFILYYYYEPQGILFLRIHWLIIIFGIIFKLIFNDKYEIFSLLLYLVLGWMVIIIFESITTSMSSFVKLWLLSGGIFYTVGVIFYIWTKLAWHHAIWHIFVILGCLGHFIALINS
ncbi:MAG: hemolysin III family protein [Saprospiraceae bacterium]|nr:hemolysin III family protein [Saprospiraceae bacterium]